MGDVVYWVAFVGLAEIPWVIFDGVCVDAPSVHEGPFNHLDINQGDILVTHWKPVRALSLLLLALWSCGELPAYAQSLSPADTPAPVDPPTLCIDYGNNITDAMGVAVGPEGETYVTGARRVPDQPGTAIATVKYTRDGKLAWSQSYQDPFACFDHGDDLTTDRHGNVYVTGTTVLSGPSPSNGRTVAETAYVTIKYDRDGHRKWLARYQGDARKTDQAKVVAVNDEGDVYVTGVSQGETHPEIATVKYDGHSGRKLWAVRYGVAFGATVSRGGAVLDGHGHLYIAGTVCSQQAADGLCSDYQYEVLKYDAFGRLLWSAAYENGAGYASQASKIAVDRAGNIYVTGTSCSTPYVVSDNNGAIQAGCTEADYATIKLRPDGERVWVARYHGAASGNYAPGALAVGECEDVYVTGSGAMADQGFHVLKYDREGHEVWATVFRGDQYGSPSAIAVDRYGHAYIAGLTTLLSSAYFTVVAYGNNGDVLWDQEVQGADTTRDWVATAVVAEREGLLHATGGTLDVPIAFGGATQSWYLTRTYEADTGELVWSKEF